ncbi:hypothetical protein [Spirillospora albida]|uniref:hypothetical protein n=1 Tax=Spirillospora albida TaxID=58123 RepID=UPI0012F9C95D|nr:hypothetical protein [Spirillospora albida]
MNRAEQAAVLLQRVRQQAEDYGPALIRAQTLLHEGALVGPAAERLAATMVSAHRDTRAAFYDAFEQVRRVAAEHGNRVPEPYIPGPLPPPRTPPGVGSGSPQALTALSTELTRAAGTWESSARVLSGILSGLALPTTPARTISGAARRVSSQRAEVERRRAELLKAEQQITQNALTGVRTFVDTPKRKPPLQAAWDAQFKHFLPGVGTGVKDLGLMSLAYSPVSAPVYFAVNRDGWMNRGPVGQTKMIYQAVQHPGLFLKSIIDWEQWKKDPMRAYGETVPSLIIAAATMGTGAGSGITARFSTLLRRKEQKPETPAANTAKSAEALDEAAKESPKAKNLGERSAPTQAAPKDPAPGAARPPQDIKVAGGRPSPSKVAPKTPLRSPAELMAIGNSGRTLQQIYDDLGAETAGRVVGEYVRQKYERAQGGTRSASLYDPAVYEASDITGEVS